MWASEFERVFQRKKTVVILIAYALLLVLECAFLYAVGGVSFYNPQESVQLNQLNTAPFLMRDLAIVIHFVILPMLVIDSFNGEYTSGALRLVLLRPQSRLKLWFVKWGVQCIIALGLTVLSWAVGNLFGYLAMPQAEYTELRGFGIVGWDGALMGSLVFYLFAYLVFVAVISLGSLISVLLPNAIISYIVLLGLLIGSLYVTDQLVFFLSLSDEIFRFLASWDVRSFALPLGLVLVLTVMFNMFLWRKKEWMR